MRTLTIVFALLVVLTAAAPAHAQRGLRAQVGIGVGGGIVDGMSLCTSDGLGRFHADLEITRCNRNHSYWSFTAGILRKDYRYASVAGREVVPMAQMTLDVGYNHPLLADRGRNVTLFASLGALAGYESVGWGDRHLKDGAQLLSDDAFIYGVSLGASVESYLCDRVILLVRLRERCTLGSPTGQFHTQVSIGFRFIIN